uniref:Uncharacterized protein n=1 Tax=Meloidogyne enterolobii TaxID=390850 RepID=A0A6V7TUK1_MELEN|nr:unnamed protein product [Meloidogyne enterolobii]
MKFLHYYQIERFSFFVDIFVGILSIFLYYFGNKFSSFSVLFLYFSDSKFSKIDSSSPYSFYCNFAYVEETFLYFFGNILYYIYFCLIHCLPLYPCPYLKSYPLKISIP